MSTMLLTPIPTFTVASIKIWKATKTKKNMYLILDNNNSINFCHLIQYFKGVWEKRECYKIRMS